MNPKIKLMIALTLLLAFFTVHLSVSHYVLQQQKEKPSPTVIQTSTPNFASIDNVKHRKQVFFDYLIPYITKENLRIQKLRDDISKINDQKMQPTSARIKQLAMRYRIPANNPQLKQRLLKKIDIIPPSLVLAQAAIESAWGTSRFATKGNNFFGQWCFTKDCGLVPSKRSHGSYHEVKKFNSPEESIASYMLNLNSHPAYKALRDKRDVQRKKNEPINGCLMAEGLIEYSERKTAYVESLKQLMRTNQLENKHSGHCKKAAALPQKKPVLPQDALVLPKKA